MDFKVFGEDKSKERNIVNKEGYFKWYKKIKT